VLFPGVIDGVNRGNHESGEHFWVAVPSTAPPICKVLEMLNYISPKLDLAMRGFIMLLPASFLPKPVRYGGVFEISLEKKYGEGAITRFFQDPKGEFMTMITAVTEVGNILYLGSLTNDHVKYLEI
jgi:hypothetical protein